VARLHATLWLLDGRPVETNFSGVYLDDLERRGLPPLAFSCRVSARHREESRSMSPASAPTCGGSYRETQRRIERGIQFIRVACTLPLFRVATSRLDSCTTGSARRSAIFTIPRRVSHTSPCTSIIREFKPVSSRGGDSVAVIAHRRCDAP